MYIYIYIYIYYTILYGPYIGFIGSHIALNRHMSNIPDV